MPTWTNSYNKFKSRFSTGLEGDEARTGDYPYQDRDGDDRRLDHGRGKWYVGYVGGGLSGSKAGLVTRNFNCWRFHVDEVWL